MSKTPIKKDPIPEIFYKIGEILKRLKILEERTHSFAEKLENLNNEIIELKKDLSKTRAEFNNEIEKIKKQLGEINNRIKVFERELPRLAKKNEIEVLKKVFSLWDPMNFVSEKELEFILEDKFEEFKNKLIKELKNNNVSQEFLNSIQNVNISKKIERNNQIPNLAIKASSNLNNLNKTPTKIENSKLENKKVGLRFPEFRPKVNIEKSDIKDTENKEKEIKEMPFVEKKDQVRILSVLKENDGDNILNKENVIENEKTETLTNKEPKAGEFNESIKEIQDNLKSNLSQPSSFSFKHIKFPKKFLQNLQNIGKENINNNEKVNNISLNKKEENNEIYGFLDVKAIKNQKLKKIEEKFKEKIKKSYDEFKKDWMEL